MTDSGFAIDRDTDRAGSTVHLRLGGRFERAAHRELRRALGHELGRARAISLVIDVERVTAVGSECVEILLLGYTKALRGGHGYEIVNAWGPVRQAFEAARLCARRDDEVLYAPAWWEAGDRASGLAEFDATWPDTLERLPAGGYAELA